MEASGEVVGNLQGKLNIDNEDVDEVTTGQVTGQVLDKLPDK